MCNKNEKYSNLKQALTEYSINKLSEYEVTKDFDDTLSNRDKRKRNRWWREKIGIKDALYPEVDNAFEQTRSNVMRWWYEFIDKSSL